VLFQNKINSFRSNRFFKNEAIDFAPGEKFKYNNSGYILIGYLLIKISGQSYAQFVEE